MPQLHWNDVDFLEFFATIPTIADFEVSHRYEIERAGLRLALTIWQLESVIQASLTRDGSNAELVSLVAYVRGEARLIDDKRGRYVEFEDCVLAPNRFSYIQLGNPFDRQQTQISNNIQLRIDPDIQISLAPYASRT